MIFAGIDIGSVTAKAALIRDSELVGVHMLPSGYDHRRSAGKVLTAVLDKLGISQSAIHASVSTGYGRTSVDFADKAVTEITCHAAGARFLDPSVRAVIDVGGQDSKAIVLSSDGGVDDFAMNDKCAAGTGRFIEVMAGALEVELEQLAKFSAESENPVKISNTCTVFAESEVISMIAQQKKRRDIIAGIHEAAAARVASLAMKTGVREPVVMTGGVAKNAGMVAALQRHLGLVINVSAYPQENGAIGAAVLASRLKQSS